MHWEDSRDEETTFPDERPALSNQSKMISNALRQADKAIHGGASNYDPSTTSGGSSSYGDSTTDSTIKTGVDTRAEKQAARAHTNVTIPAAVASTTKTTLNLKSNDTQFHIIADLIVSKYLHLLDSGAASFSVTPKDKEQLERMVSRDSFVDAVRYRLQYCPEDSFRPIHVVTRQCRALGLHRSGNQNPLYAPAGTVIQIERPSNDAYSTVSRATESVFTYDESLQSKADIGRQQLVAELREASTLMAESVTPEAAAFWRRHVVELQTRLRNLYNDKDVFSGPVLGAALDAAEVLCQDERVRAFLTENIAYVPAARDALLYLPADDYTEASRRPRQVYQSKYRVNRAPSGDSSAGSATLDTELLDGMSMVDVVAPANLPEGYTFEAEIEGRRFMATVPPGGVRKGHTFSCYMRDFDKGQSDMPTGKWRDGLWECFKHGFTHPMLLNSFFCPLRALSQVMTRMDLDFTGLPSRDIPKTGVWSTSGMTTTIMVFWVLLNTFIFAGLYYKLTKVVPVSGADIASFVLVNVGMFAYMVYATSNTRTILRERSMIRENCCKDLNDIMYASMCMPCVISQMGRHTVSYEEHKGIFCTDTGLEPGVNVDFAARDHHGSYRIW